MRSAAHQRAAQIAGESRRDMTSKRAWVDAHPCRRQDDYVGRALDAAPPLTDEQVKRVARLLTWETRG